MTGVIAPSVMAALRASEHGLSASGAALISAGVAATVAVVGLWLNGARAERARRRVLYGEALAAVIEYQEFAYAVQRRGATDPDAERGRISEALRLVQARLARYDALLRVERSAKVHVAYAGLVTKTREVAGSHMRGAWQQPPAQSDAAMNQPDVDLSSIRPFEQTYLDSVKSDLTWWPPI